MAFDPQEALSRATVEEYQRLLDSTLEDDLAWILSSEKGQRFMWHLIGATGFLSAPFFGNSTDTLWAGKRKVGEMLIDACDKADVESVAKMITAHCDLKRMVASTVKG